MAQAEHEDTPEIAATRPWRMGMNAQRVADHAREELADLRNTRCAPAEHRARLRNLNRMLDRLVEESRWASHVAIYGVPAEQVAA